MMVAPTLVKITLYDPAQSGDAGTPFVGRAAFKPTLVRHIEGETPPDYVVTDKRFFVTFGEALMDGLVVVQPATPGVAWVYLEPTDYGVYADLWGWEICFFRPGQADNLCRECHTYAVPTDAGIVDFGDLIQIDPVTPSPAWLQLLNQEIADRIAGDANLQTQIDAITAGDVESVNGFTGAVTVALVEDPPASFFYELQVTGT